MKPTHCFSTSTLRAAVWPVLENVPADDLEEVIGFCIEVGLPVTLRGLGLDEVADEKIMAVAACAENDTLRNMPFKVTAERVAAAIAMAATSRKVDG